MSVDDSSSSSFALSKEQEEREFLSLDVDEDGGNDGDEMEVFEAFQSDMWQELKEEQPSLFLFAYEKKLTNTKEAQEQWKSLQFAERKQWIQKAKNQK